MNAHKDYRINYGNGQVSGLMTKAEAVQELRRERDAQYGNFAFIQTWDMDGEWHKVTFSEERASKIEHAARHGREA